MRIVGGDDRIRFTVRVQPRATRSEVVGAHGDSLRVRVQAPPVDGAANAAVIELLARVLGVHAREVRVVSGETSRTKTMEVPAGTRARLEALAVDA